MPSRVLTLCALAAVAALAQPAPSAEPSHGPPGPGPKLNGTELPEMSTAMVHVPWSELRPLLVPRPAEEREAPPAPFSVGAARYRAEFLSGRTMQVTAAYDVAVWKQEGWVMVPLIGDGVAPRSVSVEGQPASLTKTDGAYLGVLLSEPGTHAVELEFRTALAIEEATVRFEFRTAPTPVTELSLRLPPQNKNIQAPLAAGIDERRTEEALVAEISFPPTDAIAALWPLPLPPKDERPAEPAVETRVAAAPATLATVTDRYLSCRTRIDYQVLAGATNAFQVVLPEEVELLAATGTGAEVEERREQGQLVLDIAVNHPIPHAYVLNLSYEQPITPEQGEPLALPLPRVPGVARSTGHVAVAAWGPVRVEPHEAGEGIRRIDPAELPADLRRSAAHPVLMAFRYHDAPPPLTLAVEKLRDVAVRVAQVDDASAVTVFTEDGLAVTSVTYTVRNNSQQFLRLTLPEDAEALAAEVGGEPVKPAYEGGESGAILLPLRNTAGSAQAGLSCSITYQQQGPSLDGLRASHRWTAPKLGMMTSRFRWTAYLPEGRMLLGSSGDLERLAVDRPREGLGLRQAASYRPGAVAPLQEGVERFFITDINNPAEAAATGGPRQFQDGPARGSGASSPSIAGMLPVRISLPETGRSYVFGRALTPEGQVVSVTITTVPRGARPYGLGALGVAAGLVAFLIARYAMRRLPRWWTAVALLALAAVAVGVFRDSALGLTIALSALVGAALAVGLRALRNRNRPEPAGGEAP